MLKKLFKFYIIIQYMCSCHIEFAKQSETPWVALIMLPKNARCGGALINDQFVVTAAHCFDGIDFTDKVQWDQIIVILGEWIIDKDPDCDDEIVYDYDDEFTHSCDTVAKIQPAKITIHEDYDENSEITKFKADIAIIKLKWIPRISILIQNIELPNVDDCNEILEGENIKFTGFGEIYKNGNTSFTNKKKKINMKIIKNQRCEDYFKGSEKKRVNSNIICGLSNAVTCVGDSGSAATKLTKNMKKVLIGVLSFGAKQCSDTNIPAAFTKIACFVEWINLKVSEQSSAIIKPKSELITPTKQSVTKKESMESEEDPDNVRIAK